MSNDETEHDWFTDRIAAALAGGLTADERSRFDAHVATCDACRQELDEMRELEGTMTTLFAPALAGPDFEDRLIARFRDRTTHRLSVASFVERRLRLPAIPALTGFGAHPAVRRAAVAAAAIIVLGGFGYVGSTLMERNRLPGMAMLDSGDGRARSASDLRQIGQAMLGYSNENKGTYPSGPYDADDSVLLPPDGHGDGIANPSKRAEQTRQKIAQVFTAPSSAADKWDFGGGANSALNWSGWNKQGDVSK